MFTNVLMFGAENCHKRTIFRIVLKKAEKFHLPTVDLMKKTFAKLANEFLQKAWMEQGTLNNFTTIRGGILKNNISNSQSEKIVVQVAEKQRKFFRDLRIKIPPKLIWGKIVLIDEFKNYLQTGFRDCRSYTWSRVFKHGSRDVLQVRTVVGF